MMRSSNNLSTYINIESSVMIIVGIFLSVIIAFSVGMIVQWIVRFAFSFNVKKTYKYWTGYLGRFCHHGHSLFPSDQRSQRIHPGYGRYAGLY